MSNDHDSLEGTGALDHDRRELDRRTTVSRAARILHDGLAAFVLLPVIASTAAAQGSPERSGFWMNVGFGWGSADFNFDGADTERESGIAGQIALGGTITPQLLVGVESNGWYKDEDDVRTLLGTSFALVAYYYPVVEQNFFVKGGVGLASYLVDNGDLEDDQGVGLLVGIGYDLPIGTGYSITPVATFQYGIMGDVNGLEGASQNIISLGATFTVH